MAIKGSEDKYYSLVSTKIRPKNWLLALVPRARWPRPEMYKPAPIMMSPTKNSKSEIFQCFFQSKLEDFPHL